MKYIFLLLIFISSSVYAQRDKDALRQINEKTKVYIPKSAEWYNVRQAFNTLDVRKKVMIIHFWDPSNPLGDIALQEVKNMADNRRQTLVISVLRSDLPNAKNKAWVEGLLEMYDVKHPVAVLDDLSALLPYELDEYGSFICVLENGQLFKTLSIFDEDRSLPAYLDSITLNDKNPSLSSIPNANELLNETPRIDALFDLPVSICADNKSGRIFVADARKQQIIVISDDGRVIETVGIGAKGNAEGRFSLARFNRPAGMAFDEQQNLLYVADMLNHQIKVLDFNLGEVRNLLGSGSKSLIPPTQIDGTSAAMDQPSDLLLVGNDLYISMMGDRQLWKMNLLTKRAVPIAGKGDYKLQDGIGRDASFETMSSLALDEQGNIMVIDQNKPYYRLVNPQTSEVSTVHYSSESQDNESAYTSVLIKDSERFYLDASANRMIQLANGEKPRVFVGSAQGEGAYLDGKKTKARFWNPIDMCFLGNEILVLDQFNRLIRRVNTKKAKTSTLQLSDYKFIFMSADAYTLKHFEYLEELSIRYNERNEVAINIQLPPGYKWDKEGRNEIVIIEEREHRLLNTDPTSGFVVLDVMADSFFPNVSVQLFMTVKDDEERIQFKCVVLTIPFLFHEAGENDFEIPYRPFD